MKLTPGIIEFNGLELVGLQSHTSLSVNRIGELWREFYSKLNLIQSSKPTELHYIKTYPEMYFKQFDPQAEFEIAAAVRPDLIEAIPEDFKTITLPSGKYAVFNYKGSSKDPSVFRYIFTEWLPASGYKLASRSHFDVLGEKYSNDSTDSEEEIWIPLE